MVSARVPSGSARALPRGRRRLTWEGEIKMGLQELGGWGVVVVDWIISCG